MERASSTGGHSQPPVLAPTAFGGPALMEDLRDGSTRGPAHKRKEQRVRTKPVRRRARLVLSSYDSLCQPVKRMLRRDS